MKKALCLIVMIFSLSVARPALAAGPMLKFDPSSKSVSNGETFTVTLGVDSGTEASQAVDAWVTFDASKLEVVSIVPAANPPFSFTLGKNIYNDTGKFNISCSPNDTLTYNAVPLVGDLAVVTFKAKATGTASVNFTCTTGSSTDSNIFNMDSNDVISCSSNQNGVYTITAGSSTTNPTATPTTTQTSSGGNDNSSSGSSELPQTGMVETTVGLVIFGLMSLLSSMALRFL